jgi:hypothetical protein
VAKTTAWLAASGQQAVATPSFVLLPLLLGQSHVPELCARRASGLERDSTS